MNPRTIAQAAKVAIEVLTLASRAAQTPFDWLQINQMTCHLLAALNEIEQAEYLDRQLRQEARETAQFLRNIQHQSCSKVENAKS